MKIEDQCTSLELSRRLAELGIKQDSLFFWTSGGIVSRLDALPILESNYSAFTCAELGELLPKNQNIVLMIFENGLCQLWHDETKYYVTDCTETNARARLLIHLIENGLMPK